MENETHKRKKKTKPMFFQVTIAEDKVLGRTPATSTLPPNLAWQDTEDIWYQCPFCPRPNTYGAHITHLETYFCTPERLHVLETCCGSAVLDVQQSGTQWHVDSEGHIGAPFKRIRRVCKTLVAVHNPGVVGNWAQPAMQYDWTCATEPEHPYLVPTRETACVEYEDGSKVYFCGEDWEGPGERPAVPCPGLLLILEPEAEAEAEAAETEPKTRVQLLRENHYWDWPGNSAMCTLCSDIAPVEYTVRRVNDSMDGPDVTVMRCDVCSAFMILDVDCSHPDTLSFNGLQMTFIPAKLVTRAGIAGTPADTWTSRETFNLNDFTFGNNLECSTFLYEEDAEIVFECQGGPRIQLATADGD
jgi:hypothetical protein